MSSNPNVADIYPLSPAQQGMLMVVLLADDPARYYFDQIALTLTGRLDAAAWREAWRRVVARHAALRTLFVWERREKPLQVVRREVELPWRDLDWRELPEDERERRLEALLREDHAQGFELGKAPLLRASLIRWEEGIAKFVWSFHHLILDGWSISLVYSEVLACYAALAAGREPQLPAAPRFGDYIAWLKRQDQAEAQAFWRRELIPLPEPLPLPWDGNPSPGEGTGWASEQARTVLPPSRAQALAGLARRHRLTLNTLFQGAWGLLLSRLGGRRELLFGSVVSGRPAELPGVESMIGLFINALPVRIAADPGRPLADWLSDLQERQIEQRRFEHSLLEEIQAWAGAPRERPLFETLLIFQNFPLDPLAQQGEADFTMRASRLKESTHYPLALYVAPDGEGGMLLGLSYHRARFDAASIDRLGALLGNLLGSFAGEPEAPLFSLPLLRAEERQEILAAGRGPLAAAEPESVPARIAAQAARTPDTVAAESGAGFLTYAELAARAGRLAGSLRSSGVGPGDIAGIRLERSLGLVVALLAVWKAGAAYLPLDPAYPAERLAFLVADSGARVVLDAEAVKAPPTGGVATPPLPDAAAYVIYTSGSTGKPKGVAVPHRALATYVRSAGESYEVGPGDRVLQFASISFDTSAEEIYPCLTRGATLVLRESGMTGSFDGFLRELERLRITLLDLPTAYWHELTAELVQAGSGFSASVRLVILGGEEARADRLAAWRERVGDGVRLVNTYGPTEATIVATGCDLSRGPIQAAGRVPIGRAVPGARAHVLGLDLELLPPGIDGELFLGGAGLAWGYLGRPETTAERFVPDPFATLAGDAGERLYRTGDLARRKPDGGLEFRGRADGQVKLRGFRIELGEVEAALRRLPGVGEAAAVVQEDAQGDRRLVAFAVPASSSLSLVPSELRAALKSALPDHMVPSSLALLPDLPRTPSGKIDRPALARTAVEPDAGELPYERPRTPAEELLAGIWSELLKVERVGVADDFFVLGGHSLLVAQALSRIRQALGVEVPLVEFFRRPTVAQLAAWIEQGGKESEPLQPPPIHPLPRDGRPLPLFPLSFAQERVWFLDQLAPGGNQAYNFQVAIRIWGPLDVGVLERTLSELVRRHEVLRTSFPTRDGRPVQVVHEAAPIYLPLDDLAVLPPEERWARAEALIDEQIRIPFDLAVAPLLRWRLVRHDEMFHTLIQVEHHFVHDGWSFAILLRELKALYEAFSRDLPSPLPELPVQYGDYALWQREWLAGEAMERLLAYWKGRLAGSPQALEIATDRPRPEQGSFRGDIALLPVEPELYESLRRFGRSHGFTLYMTMLAGFLSLLARYTGEEDIVIGTSNANRRVREIEGMIGMVVNSLVLRADLAGRPSFRELLARVRELALATYAHQDMPFERLVQELRLERRPGRNPLFQLMFNFHDAPVPEFRFADLEMFPEVRGNRTAKLDMNLIVVPRAEQRVGRGDDEQNRCATLHWEYNTDLFDRATVERMAGHFQTLLAGAAAHPEVPWPELPLLPAVERTQVLADWNDTAADFPRDSSIPGRFAACAARTPDSVAVTADGESLSYGALAATAHRLAHRLRSLGAGPGALVALAAERSPAMVPAILGILASGAAYLPLDPASPPERLALLLADSGAQVLVASEERLLANFPVESLTTLALDRDRAAIAAAPDTPPTPLPAGDELAYAMYTSGSTGTPKGVLVTHRNVLRLVFGGGFARFGPREVFLQLAPLSFDASTLELWGPLLHGGRLAVFPRENPTLESLGEALSRHGVTTLWLTAGLFHQMVDGNLPGLRPLTQLLAGGDALSPAHVRRALSGLPGLTLIDGYGPTEGTTFTCCHPLASPDEVGTTVPIGRPIGNARTYVLDRELRPLPVGVPGELLIGGDGLALGYLGRPDLTAERFVPDPISPDARLYRTGDRVRWRPDGTLEFLGRLDFQVKVRGFRVEPGEIEAALATHPAVAAVAVLALADGPEGAAERRLVACVVPRPGEGGDDLPAALRHHLASRLPAHLLPAAWTVLPGLPLNANGKVDRRALARLARERAAGISGGIGGGGSAGGAFVAPRTPEEKAIAAIWREVLGIERVGAGDDFFLLGGHSLSVLRVRSRLARDLGIELPVGELFAHTTLAGLAAVIAGIAGRSRRAARSAEPKALSRGEKVTRLSRLMRQKAIAGRAFPLSPAQQRLWFLDRIDPGNPANTIFRSLYLDGSLDAFALAQALAEIVQRHEALRATFPVEGDGPCQRIAPPGELSLPLVDLAALPAERRRPAAVELAGRASRHPFDLARGPLFQPTLVRLSAGEHAFFLAVHHVAADGWSMGLLWGELATLYGAFTAGEPSPLPEPALHYPDFAAWQRELLTDELLAAEIDWWREQLAGAATLLELPTDRLRPAVESFRGTFEPVTLPRDVADSLRALSRQGQATLFMTLLAAFEVLLYRYTGQREFVVGTTVAGRDRAELEGVVGIFTNTPPLPARLAGNPAFRQLLGEVRRSTVEAYDHQEVPFERLVEELQPERHLSHHPLYQVHFALQNQPPEAPSFAGLASTPLAIERGLAKLDLTLDLADTPEDIGGYFEYSTDLFEPATIARLRDHFLTLLRGIAADPDRRIDELPLLNAAERDRLLFAWNPSGYSLPPAVPVAIAAQARRTPEAPAVLCGDERLTYAELDLRANRLARHLRRRGVGPDTRVGLCVERSLAMTVALLGILKAGAAYVPLDPDYPQERLALMIADTRMPLLLTEARLASRLPLFGVTGPAILLLDEEGPRIEAEDAADPDWEIAGEGLAYVVYTSGSTGKPKGVGVPHRALANHASECARIYRLGPADRALQFTSISFDITSEEVFPTWIAGGAVVPRPPGLFPSFAELEALLARHRVTVVNLPTAYWHEWASELHRTRRQPPADLRLVVIGTEQAHPERLAEWLEITDGRVGFANSYASTECTVTALIHQSGPGSLARARAGHRIPVGRPIENCRVYVLDSRLEPVPIGVPGDVHIGGANVSRGYLEQPERTAAVFLPDPFGACGPGARIYRQGDRGRFLPNGELEVLGRSDAQVKVRGYRIEPGEIETVLARHPAVDECVVLVQPDGPSNKRLAAYVAQDPDRRTTAEELRAYLKERLPEYMVPAGLAVLDRLPLNRNGKVDRRALAAIEPAEEAAREAGGGRSPLEDLVLAIWRQVLGRERIGTHDDFFALGGHSLLATQVIARVRQELGVELPLRVLFEEPTVAGLAAAAEAARRSAGGLTLPPLVPVPRDGGSLPCSFAQQRLWVVNQLAPGSPAYNLLDLLHWQGPLDREALARALDEIVRRHEVLRTTFDFAGGRAIQRIAPPAPADFAAVDLGGEPEPLAEAVRRAISDGSRPFDPAQGPLFRATLYRRSAGDHLLLLALHHIVTDGNSNRILLRELLSLYQAFSRGLPSPLPEPPVQYADFAVWQRAWLAGDVLKAQLAYWRGQLAAAPPALALPSDRPRPAVESMEGARHLFPLPAALVRGLEELGRQNGATLFMSLLAGFSALLGRAAGQDDLVVGWPIAGRGRAELEGALGLFSNLLPERVRLPEEGGFARFLADVRATTLDAYTHGDLPFELLVEAIRPERHLAYHPVFQVFFVLHHGTGAFAGSLPTPPGVSLALLEAEPGTSLYDLSLAVSETADGAAAVLEYKTGLWDRATIERMAGHLLALLSGAAAAPGQPLDEIPLLSAAERREIAAWNDTAVALPPNAAVHQLFAARVAADPGALALVAVTDDGNEERLTYRDLDARAERLAHRLRRAGVAPGVLVGICLERSATLFVSLLAVLKSGGAYVPLDPTHPAERRASILADAGVRLLLSTGRLARELPHDATLLDLDFPESVEPEAPASAAIPAVDPDDLAYVIFTSGSTGKPKGVAIRHGALTNFLLSMARRPGLSAGDTWVTTTTVSFDMAVPELYLPLVVGGTVVFAGRAFATDGRRLAALLAGQRTTVFQATPSTWRLLLASGWTGMPELKALCGAEALPAELARELLPRVGSLWNLYGPTETTVWSSLHPVTAADARGGTVTVGHTFANTSLHVLDRRLGPVPVGVTGELAIGGAGLARGYLGRPDLTAERFVPDPEGAPGARLYRTGDLGRRRPDGGLDFLGRGDHQVKVRGFRIELGEIEAALRRQPAVRQTVVTVREEPGSAGGPQIVAYVVAEPGAPDASADALKAALRRELPEFMVPAFFVLLPELPLNPNGKVDRKALPAPGAGFLPRTRERVAPRNRVEEQVVEVWSTVLGLPEISVHDNFFELGGNSLSATQAVARLEAAFRIDLGLPALFASPTVASLSETIMTRELSGANNDLLAALLTQLEES